MGWFTKKPDPISTRAQDLNRQIAALEKRIRDLETQQTLPPESEGPRLRSTAHPPGHSASNLPVVTPGLPIFEPVDQERLQNPDAPTATPQHFNELGVRKYDLLAAWKRLMHHWRAPTASNPKLVSYLAAGSIQGLRPLRFEKRVARNRFLVLVAILILVLLGMFKVFFRG